MIKVLTIGLDGATFRLIKPWAASGLLPNMSRILREGATGVLRSTIHPLSPPAWTSFITGKNPGKHGIYDFVIHEPNNHRLVYANGGLRRGKSLWKLLSEAGRRVIVVNVPMTYPPEPVNGLLVSGFDTPGAKARYTYPPGLKNEIRREVGEYLLRDYPHHCDAGSFLEQIHRLIDTRERLMHHLLGNHPWDFFMIVFNSTDLAQHAYWQYMDEGFSEISRLERSRYQNAVLDIYRRLDRLVGEVLEKHGRDALTILMSDHGAGPAYKVVFLNQWLNQEGFLAYDQGDGTSLFSRTKLSILKGIHLNIRRHLPPETIDWLTRSFPGLRQQTKSHLTFSEIDWANTRAYAFGRESASIFVNLRGRYPHGTVEPGAEYDGLLETIGQRLLKLTDPDTGCPVVERVHRRDEVYHGECLGAAPDLLVVWRNHQYTCRSGYDDRRQSVFASSLEHSEMSEISTLKKGGTHTPEGILMAIGEGVCQGTDVSGSRIVDLAPTILYLLDVPIPADMDGEILTGLLTEELLRNRPPRYGEGEPALGPEEQAYGPHEEEAVRRRLEGLGYL
jgi:predicted AlkP superfamily phosphohydrolase/phosphomutase